MASVYRKLAKDLCRAIVENWTPHNATIHNDRAMGRRVAKFVGICAALTLWAGSARAQAPSDPRQDCVAASERGQNERDEGKFRSARQSFASCTREACPRVVGELCSKWLHELDLAAPTIVLSAKDQQGNDVSDVKVTFDGVPYATSLDGKPIEADAGAHVLRFEREGSQPVEETVSIRAGEHARLVNVTLLPAAAQSGVSALPSQTEFGDAVGSEAAGVGATGPSRPSSAAKYATAGAMGLVALAAVGTGAYFLVQSNQAGDDAATLRARLGPINACSHQPPPTCQQLSAKVGAQHDDLAIATALFVGGGLLAAGAVVTMLLWPKASSPPPKTEAWIAPSRDGVEFLFVERF